MRKKQNHYANFITLFFFHLLYALFAFVLFCASQHFLLVSFFECAIRTAIKWPYRLKATTMKTTKTVAVQWKTIEIFPRQTYKSPYKPTDLLTEARNESSNANKFYRQRGRKGSLFESTNTLSSAIEGIRANNRPLRRDHSQYLCQIHKWKLKPSTILMTGRGGGFSVFRFIS